MEYGQYEKEVRFPTLDVFVQFDDAYEQFTEFFLEQGRKRKMASGKTPAQVLKELTLHHVALQQRLDTLHEFRSNHELLQSVVTQVLKDETENGCHSASDECSANHFCFVGCIGFVARRNSCLGTSSGGI